MSNLVSGLLRLTMTFQLNWEEACLASYDGGYFCRLGVPFPEDLTGVDVDAGIDGLKFNCYVNRKIDDYFVPQLEKELKEYVPQIAARMAGESTQ